MQTKLDHIVQATLARPTLAEIGKEELLMLTQEFPYAAVLQFLYTKRLQQSGDARFGDSVTRTALFFNNPHWLYHQLKEEAPFYLQQASDDTSDIPGLSAMSSMEAGPAETLENEHAATTDLTGAEAALIASITDMPEEGLQVADPLDIETRENESDSMPELSDAEAVLVSALTELPPASAQSADVLSAEFPEPEALWMAGDADALEPTIVGSGAENNGSIEEESGEDDSETFDLPYVSVEMTDVEKILQETPEQGSEAQELTPLLDTYEEELSPAEVFTEEAQEAIPEAVVAVEEASDMELLTPEDAVVAKDVHTPLTEDLEPRRSLITVIRAMPAVEAPSIHTISSVQEVDRNDDAVGTEPAGIGTAIRGEQETEVRKQVSDTGTDLESDSDDDAVIIDTHTDTDLESDSDDDAVIVDTHTDTDLESDNDDDALDVEASSGLNGELSTSPKDEEHDEIDASFSNHLSPAVLEGTGFLPEELLEDAEMEEPGDAVTEQAPELEWNYTLSEPISPELDEDHPDATDLRAFEPEDSHPIGMNPGDLLRMAGLDAHEQTELTIEPLHCTDYFAYIGVTVPAEERIDLFHRQSRSFTGWIRSMKRIHPERSTSEFSATESDQVRAEADQSNEHEEVLTETMAEIYALQGLKHKAIDIYEKLCLLNPAKSATFANRLTELKGN